MDTNAVIVVLAEPFGLDNRPDIFGEIVLQEVRQNFLPARPRVLSPSLRYRATGLPGYRLNGEISGRKSGAEMARLYNISAPTVSRIVAQHRISPA